MMHLYHHTVAFTFSCSRSCRFVFTRRWITIKLTVLIDSVRIDHETPPNINMFELDVRWRYETQSLHLGIHVYLHIIIHVDLERSFGGTNGEPPSEASQLRKGGPGGPGGPPPENFKNLHCKWCNLRYS